jgi:hypothetical protein
MRGNRLVAISPNRLVTISPHAEQRTTSSNSDHLTQDKDGDRYFQKKGWRQGREFFDPVDVRVRNLGKNLTCSHEMPL